MRIVDKLRNKPEAARRGLALIGAGAITVVVIALWAVTFSARFDNNGGSYVAEFDTISGNIDSFVAGVQASFNEVDDLDAVLGGAEDVATTTEGSGEEYEEYGE